MCKNRTKLTSLSLENPWFFSGNPSQHRGQEANGKVANLRKMNCEDFTGNTLDVHHWKEYALFQMYAKFRVDTTLQFHIVMR